MSSWKEKNADIPRFILLDQLEFEADNEDLPNHVNVLFGQAIIRIKELEAANKLWVPNPYTGSGSTS